MVYDKKEILSVIQAYLELIENSDFPVDEKKLSLCLDNIAVMSNCLDEKIFDEKDYPEAPVIDAIWLRDMLVKKFPELGMYNLPKDVGSNISKTEILVGHAHDDLGDIYRDLKEVSWKFQNTSEEEAIWQLNWSYTHHYGAHLRNIQWYLYNSRYEGSR